MLFRLFAFIYNSLEKIFPFMQKYHNAILHLFIESAFTKKKKQYQKYIIGDYTYGEPKIMDWNEDGATLIVGKFCSFAEGVTILLGGNHFMNRVSTYPFTSLIFKEERIIESYSNGNVVIGNDVWIGGDVKIMSGVSIGDGVVIAANSVVTKDIGSYEIVGGIPAKHIKFRFSEEIIRSMMKIKRRDWEIDKIKKHHHFFAVNDVTAFINSFGK